jgi:hypothetical protein
VTAHPSAEGPPNCCCPRAHSPTAATWPLTWRGGRPGTPQVQPAGPRPTKQVPAMHGASEHHQCTCPLQCTTCGEGWSGGVRSDCCTTYSVRSLRPGSWPASSAQPARVSPRWGLTPVRLCPGCRDWGRPYALLANQKCRPRMYPLVIQSVASPAVIPTQHVHCLGMPCLSRRAHLPRAAHHAAQSVAPAACGRTMHRTMQSPFRGDAHEAAMLMRCDDSQRVRRLSTL